MTWPDLPFVRSRNLRDGIVTLAKWCDTGVKIVRHEGDVDFDILPESFNYGRVVHFAGFQE